jgi:hypothetical protein
MKIPLSLLAAIALSTPDDKPASGSNSDSI